VSGLPNITVSGAVRVLIAIISHAGMRLTSRTQEDRWSTGRRGYTEPSNRTSCTRLERWPKARRPSYAGGRAWRSSLCTWPPRPIQRTPSLESRRPIRTCADRARLGGAMNVWKRRARLSRLPTAGAGRAGCPRCGKSRIRTRSLRLLCLELEGLAGLPVEARFTRLKPPRLAHPGPLLSRGRIP